MQKSITLFSNDLTGKYVLLSIYETLNINDGIYLSSEKIDNKRYDSKGAKNILPIIIPINGKYKIDDIDVEISDLKLENDDKSVSINVSDKEFEIVKKIVLFNNDKEVIKEFITKCYKNRKFFLEKNINDNSKIKKKTYTQYGWYDDTYIPKRDLNTIFLKKGQVDNIKNKLSEFINPETYNDYIKHGIPYKYNILLHGKPGVGKTSLIRAMASECNASVCVININSELKENKLLDAFRNINDEEGVCFIIIEDIDCIFSDRKTNDTARNNITMQGLLNCMDGFNNQEGLILILTTNYPELLDEALTRCGRIDLTIELSYIDRYQAYNMYKSFFSQDKDDSIFDKIWNNIRNKSVAPSMLLEFLFNNRKCTDIYSKIDELLKLLDKKDANIYT